MKLFLTLLWINISAFSAEKANIDFDQEVLNVQVPNPRPPKQLMFIPALMLLVLVWFLQKGRIKKQQTAAA